MEFGKLYGVGVGPGDKELLTLKALRVLRESDIVAVPLMKSGATTAYDIIKEYIEDKEVVKYTFPMTKDKKILDENYCKIAKSVEEYLKEGKTVAFITLGDVTVYSSYMQINRIINNDGFKSELVPGIPSFCAAAARLNMSLCEQDEPLMIVPASYEGYEDKLDEYGTKVFMKSSRKLGVLREALKAHDKNGVMVENCGMENEKIYNSIEDIEDKSGYFSIVIVKG